MLAPNLCSTLNVAHEYEDNSASSKLIVISMWIQLLRGRAVIFLMVATNGDCAVSKLYYSTGGEQVSSTQK
jgi:hypothetical protein